MGERSKNLAIGIFAFGAACILLWALLFIHPTVGDGGQVLQARFTNIDKVNVGTRVTFAGRPVGQVVSIDEVDSLSERDVQGGQVYIYQLGLKIDSSVNVFNCDEISIQTSGLLGERVIAITPKKGKKGQTVRRINQEIIYAKANATVEEAFESMSGITKKAERTLDELLQVIDSNQHNISSIIEVTRDLLKETLELAHHLKSNQFSTKLTSTLDHVSQATEAIASSLKEAEKGNLIAKCAQTADHLEQITSTFNDREALSASIDNLHQFLASLATAAPKMEKGIDALSSMAQNFSSFSNNTQEATEKIKQVVDKMALGEGTLGQLLVGDDLYLRGVNIFNKVDTIMDDINHYGLLFHMNRGWQRQRSRLMDQVLNVNNPRLFKQHFEQEIDSISTAMSRLSIMLESSRKEIYSPGANSKTDRKAIEKVLADLLRRIDGLSDALKLYNQELIKQD